MAFKCVDVEMERSQRALPEGDSTSLSEFEKLDDKRLLVNCYDNVVRIYDINTGMTKTLTGWPK